MIVIILQILFALLVAGAMYYALQSLGGVAVITSQVAHFQAAFSFVTLNLKNFSAIFPWVIDLVALFTAIIAIELLIVMWKVSHFVLSFVKSFKQQ